MRYLSHWPINSELGVPRGKIVKNLKISTRLSVTFTLLVTGLLVVAGVAAMQLSSMQRTQVRITENILVSVQLIHRLNTDLAKARLLELRHVFNDAVSYKENIEREMTTLQTEMDEIKKEYVPLINSDEERKAYEALLTERSEYVKLMETLFSVSRSGDGEAARAVLGGRSLELFNTSSQTLASIIAIKNQQSAAEVAAAKHVYDQALIILMIAVLASVVTAIVAAVWIIRSIQRPLRNAVDIANKVSAGT